MVLLAENGIFMFCTFLHSCNNAARNDRILTYFSMLIFVYLHLFLFMNTFYTILRFPVLEYLV